MAIREYRQQRGKGITSCKDSNNKVFHYTRQPETAVFFAARKEVITNARYRQAEKPAGKSKDGNPPVGEPPEDSPETEKDTERKARTCRLIEHGAILESIFPATTAMTGEEAKAFLSAISRLPEVVRLLKNQSDSQDLQRL